MILPPPSYEELFPQRSLEQGNTTLEDTEDKRKEVKSVTCQKFNESNTDEILPLRDMLILNLPTNIYKSSNN